MDSDWYMLVPATEPISQGDIVLNCPILTWKQDVKDPRGLLSVVPKENDSALSRLLQAEELDVIVMTQACDLAQNKVDNVVICPVYPVSEYMELWSEDMEARGNNPTNKAWCKYFNAIRDGFVWNLAILNRGIIEDNTVDMMVVDFHEVLNLPRVFLEKILRKRGGKRFRLSSPYREHLSQSFARFFMRVGLPTPIPKI